jgi:hypothetical protein
VAALQHHLFLVGGADLRDQVSRRVRGIFPSGFLASASSAGDINRKSSDLDTVYGHINALMPYYAPLKRARLTAVA